MNKFKYRKEALTRAPECEVEQMPGMQRHDIPKLLSGRENIGIELGVASGALAKKILSLDKFRMLFGVDVYGDIHDDNEYKFALRNIGLDSPHKLIRLTFDDALDLFPDGYFDYIYIDGFAHTGEEGGKTLVDWYRKLKVGGIFSGDDYHADWPLVIWAVNHFCHQLRCKIHITDSSGSDVYSQYPSWFVVKEKQDADLCLDQRLVKIARLEKKRVYRARTWRSLMYVKKTMAYFKGLL